MAHVDGGCRTKKGGVVNPEFGRTLHERRRLLFSVRKRSGVRGKGASATRVAVGMTESAQVVEAIMKSYVAIPESYLNTDSVQPMRRSARGSSRIGQSSTRKSCQGPTERATTRLKSSMAALTEWSVGHTCTLEKNTRSITLPRTPSDRIPVACRTAGSSRWRSISR